MPRLTPMPRTADPSEEQADKLYGTLNDGTISTIAGVPLIHFHREAGFLEEAIRSAIGDVQAVGFTVERVEMEPGGRCQAEVRRREPPIRSAGVVELRASANCGAAVHWMADNWQTGRRIDVANVTATNRVHTG